MSLLYTGLFLWEKKLIITKLIAKFTVTGRNEVKVELVLIQPFMFWYVYYFVLILTSIFKQNLHLKWSFVSKEGQLQPIVSPLH